MMKMRQLLTLLSLVWLLVACNASNNFQLAEGGIGGTGISAGPITAFGSVFVNGVEYNVDQATFTRNGQWVSGQQEYRIGEYVTVKGTVNADGITGNATEVNFNSDLQGIVTAVSTDNITIGIMGQTIQVNSLTVFHGFNQLVDLAVGNVMEVSGVRNAEHGLIASSITLLDSFYTGLTPLEVKGLIQNLDANNKTFTMGNLLVDYSLAALDGFQQLNLQNGQYVEVKTLQGLSGNQLKASEVELKTEYLQLESGLEVELEGVITRFVSATDFSVNGQPIKLTNATKFEDGNLNALNLNAYVEVDGKIDANGVLIADEISLKVANDKSIQEIEGNITALDTQTHTIQMANKIVITDTSTIWEDDSKNNISHMSFNNLQVGDYLEIKARLLVNGKFLALKLQRENPD